MDGDPSVKQFMLCLVKNSGVISQQVVELNSWVWYRKKTAKESSAKPAVIPAWLCVSARLYFLRWNIRNFTLRGEEGRDSTSKNNVASHWTNKQITTTSPWEVGSNSKSSYKILQCPVSNPKLPGMDKNVKPFFSMGKICGNRNGMSCYHGQLALMSIPLKVWKFRKHQQIN